MIKNPVPKGKSRRIMIVFESIFNKDSVWLNLKIDVTTNFPLKAIPIIVLSLTLQLQLFKLFWIFNSFANSFGH